MTTRRVLLLLVTTGCLTALVCTEGWSWQTIINGAANESDRALAVAIDPGGDVVMGGRINGRADGTDFTVVKLAGVDGAELWRAVAEGTDPLPAGLGDWVTDVVVDAVGDVLASGVTTNAGTGRDFTVVKLAGADGVQLWRADISGTPAFRSDRATAVAVDSAGDVVAAGSTFTDATRSDFAVVKLAGGDGSELWRQTVRGNTRGGESAGAVAVDAADDVIAAGNVVNTGTGADLMVCKFSGSDGFQQWCNVIRGTAIQFTGSFIGDGARAVRVDGAGDVVVGGSLGNSGTGSDFAVLKLSGTDGTIIWRREIDVGSNDLALAVALDAIGNVVAAGQSGLSSSSSGEFFVVKLSGVDGTEFWRKTLSLPGSFNSFAEAVEVDTAGDVVSSGGVGFSDGSIEFIVLKLAGSDGTELWRLDLSTGVTDGAREVVVDAANNVVAVGGVQSTSVANTTDAIVVKLSGSSGGNFPPLCGDSVLDPGEGCDDGNLVGGDCCSSLCQLEAAGSACDDGNACTAPDTCSGGACVGGPQPNCSDGNFCTDDSCSPATGSCVHPPNTNPCDDGDACTAPDVCNGGACVSGPQPNCSDGNFCTDDSCSPATGSCVHPPNTNPCDDGNACTAPDVCSGGACVGGLLVDGDGDGVCDLIDNCPSGSNPGQEDNDVGPLGQPDGIGDVCDNCPVDFNPDQVHNSDCNDPTFFLEGMCPPLNPNLTSPVNRRGCCDGGDACDKCAQDAKDLCVGAQSGKGVVGPAGGTVSTVSGNIKIDIPAGAVDSFTSTSITEGGKEFKLQGGARVLYRSILGPTGQTFNKPVTITFGWDDNDNNGVGDGKVDTGLCADETTTCDGDSQCIGIGDGKCIGEGPVPLREKNLVLKRNNTPPFSGKCKDHDLSQAGANGCDTATAGDGSGNCALTCADGITVCIDDADCGVGGLCTIKSNPTARCCDMVRNTWEFEVCGFSEFYLGDIVGPLIPGRGSPKTDCVAEWAIHNPLNEPALDKKSLPNFAQVCTDGDPLCDSDDTANGSCLFEVGLCFNLSDVRLEKKGVVQCIPSDVAIVQVKKPRPDDKKPERAANGVALRDEIALLGPGTIGGLHQGTVSFTAAIDTAEVCTELVKLTVPLKKGIKKGKAVLKMRTTTNPSAGKTKGTKDSDTLKLTCLPAQ